MIKPAPLGRQINHPRWLLRLLPGSANRLLERCHFHHHAGAAAKRAIIHRAVAVFGEVPGVDVAQAHQPLLHRAPGDTVLADRAEHLRKQAHQSNMHVCHPPPVNGS